MCGIECRIKGLRSRWGTWLACYGVFFVDSRRFEVCMTGWTLSNRTCLRLLPTKNKYQGVCSDHYSLRADSLDRIFHGRSDECGTPDRNESALTVWSVREKGSMPHAVNPHVDGSRRVASSSSTFSAQTDFRLFFIEQEVCIGVMLIVPEGLGGEIQTRRDRVCASARWNSKPAAP